MEPTPIINVLVLTDLLAEGEQLVTTMRRAGFRVYAEAVRDEQWLRERLPGHGWDLLLAHADNARIPAQRLGKVLGKLQPDIFCLTVGSPSSQESLHASLQELRDMPSSLHCRQLAVRRISDLAATRPASLFLETLLDELENLQTRRRLRHSNAVLTELQARHQLLLAGTFDAVAYLHDGMHVCLNVAYARLFGHGDPEALMNTAFLDLVHDSEVEQTRQLLRQQTPQGHHGLLGVDAHGLPLELTLHCSKVVYQHEQCVQVILRPVHDSSRQPPSAGLRLDESPLPPLLQTSVRTSAQISAEPPLLEAAVASGALLKRHGSDDNPLLQQRLRRALDSGDIKLMFQPIVGFAAGDAEHYAVRFGLGDDTSAAPHLPTAISKHEQGERIDRLVLTRCLHLLRELHRPDLRLVVELTASSFTQPDFLSWLRGQLAEAPVQSGCLVLQVSEMDIVESPSGQVEGFCRQLRALQLPLAVTHFGGSLDPFSHLPHQYASYVELDESLTEGTDADADRFTRLHKTVSRLQASGLQTISRVDRMTLLPALWRAGVGLVRGNCLQEACARLEYAFVRDEEIMLTALP